MLVRLEVPDVLSHAGLDAALHGLQELAESELQSGDYPALYEAGVRYQPEPRGVERWLTPSQTLGRGAGDCEDLAAWRAAELRVSGEDPSALVQAVRTGPRRWHAVVARDGGAYFEDPSAALGMSAAAGLVAPVAFELEPGTRDYRARVSLSGGGNWSTHEVGAHCPVCALAGALDEAQQTELGVLPFVGPVLDLLSQVTRPPRPSSPEQAAQAARAARQPKEAQREPRTLEEGVLDLALRLRRLAKEEVARIQRSERASLRRALRSR